MPKATVSTRTAVIAALAFAALSILVQLRTTQAYDDAGLQAMLVARGPVLTTVMFGLTTIGGPLVLVPFGIAFSLWLGAARSPPTAVFYIITCVTGWGMNGLLKLIIGRARPTLIPRLHGAGWVSFPSGHAMTSAIVFGLAMVLATEGKRDSLRSRTIIVAGCLAIAGVAVSRVYLGVHYPTDVLAGVLGGWAWIGLALARRPEIAALRSE